MKTRILAVTGLALSIFLQGCSTPTETFVFDNKELSKIISHEHMNFFKDADLKKVSALDSSTLIKTELYLESQKGLQRRLNTVSQRLSGYSYEIRCPSDFSYCAVLFMEKPDQLGELVIKDKLETDPIFFRKVTEDISLDIMLIRNAMLGLPNVIPEIQKDRLVEAIKWKQAALSAANEQK